MTQHKISSVLTIGNFDGVHIGHQALIKRVLAHKGDYAPKLLTFDPHPTQILAPKLGLVNLFEIQDRIEKIKMFGIDDVIVMPFTKELSQLEPTEFFKKIIIEQFGAGHLVVGYDFSFGKNRSGNLQVLTNLCRVNHVTLEIVEPVKVGGETVSSSAIRKALLEGLVNKAEDFLARPYYITGVIEHGAQLGRRIGFPTANLSEQPNCIVKKGVYITLVELDGELLKSVTNVGDNPTFVATSFSIGKPLKIESYILDFNKDIYGEKIKVHFIKRLRDEKKFSSVEELTSQITKDVAEARNWKWKDCPRT